MATNIKQEIIDQAAHFVVGHIFVFALMWTIDWAIAFALMMLFAFIRELYQHKEKLIFFLKEFPHAPFPLGDGSVFDLTVFGLGGLSTLLWHV